MSIEENKAIQYRILIDIHSQGKLDLVDEFYDKDFIGYPDMIKGTDEVKKFITMLRNAFPNIRFTIEDQVAEGDKVVARWNFTGNHRGEFMGVYPTGKPIKAVGMTIYKISNGKAIRSWGIFDTLGILRQIGAVSI